jgi:Na+-driven multidrug efflux pump
MGNMIINMSAFSILFGMNGALDTLVAQAYGVGDLYMCGVYLNRGRFILLCAFIPLVMILF